MLKCKVIQSFAGADFYGVAGQVMEFPNSEARKFESCGFLEILPDSEQDSPPVAFETAREAREFETAIDKPKRKKK